MPELKNDPNPLASNGDSIAPYLTEDKSAFASDYWVRGRIGAMAGALVNDYNRAQFSAGPFIGSPMGGRRPAETFVVASPAVAALGNSRVRTSGDVGWNPNADEYEWNPYDTPDENFRAWVEAGCPHENARGRWGHAGQPAAYDEWTWQSPAYRRDNPYGPLTVGGRRRHGPR